MRGSVNLTAPSYLPMLFGSKPQGSSLLETLYRDAGAPAATADPLIALEQARSGETEQVARVAAEPRISRETAQFIEALATARTPARLLANPAALKVLLTATGLGDQAGNTNLATQALLSNASRADSLVNQFADKRWLAANTMFCFASKGLAVLRDPAMTADIVKAHARAIWQSRLEQTTPGLSNALEFLRRAATATDTAALLRDPAIRAVITTGRDPAGDAPSPPNDGRSEDWANDWPPRTRAQSEQAIAATIDLAQLRDPAIATQIAHGYLLAVRQGASTTSGTVAPNLAAPAEQSVDFVF
jgi:hypothetical protein